MAALPFEEEAGPAQRENPAVLLAIDNLYPASCVPRTLCRAEKDVNAACVHETQALEIDDHRIVLFLCKGDALFGERGGSLVQVSRQQQPDRWVLVLSSDAQSPGLLGAVPESLAPGNFPDGGEGESEGRSRTLPIRVPRA